MATLNFMNILLLCKRYYTGHDLIKDNFGRLHHFPTIWSRHGHHVDILAANYRGFRLEVERKDGMDRVSAPFFSPWNNYLIQVARKIEERKPDVIVASCDSHFAYMGMYISARLGVPFVLDLYHNYEDFGSNRLPGMKYMYRQALKGADLVVCDSEALARRIPPHSAQVHIAPQATDPQVFFPMGQALCREEFSIENDRKMLVYTGSVDSRFDWVAISRALDVLSDSGVNPLLLIVGSAGDGMVNHPAVRHIGKLPQVEIPKIIACADVCLIPYRSTPLSETCNPCKLSEYISGRRPIVVSRVSNIIDYLPKSAMLAYEPENGDALAESIIHQLESPIIEDVGSALVWDDVAIKYLDRLNAVAGC